MPSISDVLNLPAHQDKTDWFINQLEQGDLSDKNLQGLIAIINETPTAVTPAQRKILGKIKEANPVEEVSESSTLRQRSTSTSKTAPARVSDKFFYKGNKELLNRVIETFEKIAENTEKMESYINQAEKGMLSDDQLAEFRKLIVGSEGAAVTPDQKARLWQIVNPSPLSLCTRLTLIVVGLFSRDIKGQSSALENSESLMKILADIEDLEKLNTHKARNEWNKWRDFIYKILENKEFPFRNFNPLMDFLYDFQRKYPLTLRDDEISSLRGFEAAQWNLYDLHPMTFKMAIGEILELANIPPPNNLEEEWETFFRFDQRLKDKEKEMSELEQSLLSQKQMDRGQQRMHRSVRINMLDKRLDNRLSLMSSYPSKFGDSSKFPNEEITIPIAESEVVIENIKWTRHPQKLTWIPAQGKFYAESEGNEISINDDFESELKPAKKKIELSVEFDEFGQSVKNYVGFLYRVMEEEGQSYIDLKERDCSPTYHSSGSNNMYSAFNIEVFDQMIQLLINRKRALDNR